MPRHPVTFEPSGVTVWVETGQTVLAAARSAQVSIDATCGGRGVCGSCSVKVLDGALASPGPAERSVLSRAPAGVRLACKAVVTGPVRVRPVVAMGAPHVDVAGPASASVLVAGCDLGTTNVSVAVIEPASGRQAGLATVHNRQASFGADVMARMSAAMGGDAHELAVAARASVAEALGLAAGAARDRVQQVVVAANSAMAALFAEADVAPLAAAPYTAPELPVSGAASWLGLSPSATVRVLPPIASFVGGDVLAGLVAVDVLSATEPVLLLDIGTNAEVALWAHGRLTVASAAAGPAFEGIAGLPGSAFVAAVAGLRARGALGADGLLDPSSSEVVILGDGVRAVRVGTVDADVTVTQLDIRALQLAKAAVRVALNAVLRSAGIPPAKLGRVWVAGAFGGALDPADLVSIGMLPASLAGVVEVPGNTSLSGASMLALGFSAGEDAVSATLDRLRDGVHLVDLPNDPQFAARMMDAVRLEPGEE